MKKVSRKEAIRALIEDDFVNRLRDPEIQEMLLYGFRGYKNMTDIEIKYLYLELLGAEEEMQIYFTF